jgi:transposase
VLNNINKITTEVYTRVIFLLIKKDLKSKSLILCQDTDSAYKSKRTFKYIQGNSIKLIRLPGVSPDFSIVETIVRLLKRAFYTRRVTSEKAVLARFEKLFEQIDQRRYRSYIASIPRDYRSAGEL